MLELLGALLLSALAVALAVLGIGAVSENRKKAELAPSDIFEARSQTDNASSAEKIDNQSKENMAELESSSPVHEFYDKIKRGIQKNMFDKFVEENDLFDDRRIRRLDNLTHKVNSEFNSEKLNSVSEEWVKKNLPAYYILHKFPAGVDPEYAYPEYTYIENAYYQVSKNHYERDWLSGRKLRGGKLDDVLQHGLLSLNKYEKITGENDVNAERDESDHVWLTAEIDTALLYSHSNSRYIGKEPGLVVVLDKSVSEKFDKNYVQVSSYAATVKNEVPWNYVKSVLIPEEDYSKAMYILKVKHPEWNKETFAGKQLSEILTPIKGTDIDQYEMNTKRELSKMYRK